MNLTTSPASCNNIVLDTNFAPVITSDFNREVEDIAGYVDHQYNGYADHGPFGGSEGGSGSLRELTAAQWQDLHAMDLQGVLDVSRAAPN
jgi:hypothetical protein